MGPVHSCHTTKRRLWKGGHNQKIKQFINCGTSYLIYGIFSPCGLLYVRRTIRPLRVRFSEHKCNIINSNKEWDKNKKYKKKCNFSLPRHFKEYHNGHPARMQVFGIEEISNDPHNGRRFQRLCKRETFWIFTLCSLARKRMKKDLEVHGVV